MSEIEFMDEASSGQFTTAAFVQTHPVGTTVSRKAIHDGSWMQSDGATAEK